jgi:hypothetical protein
VFRLKLRKRAEQIAHRTDQVRMRKPFDRIREVRCRPPLRIALLEP